VTPHRILLGLVAVLASCLSSPTSAGEAGGKKYIYSNLGMRDGVCGVFEGRTESRFPAAIKTVIDTNPDSRRRAPRGTYFGCHSGSALLECEDGPYYCFRTSAVHFAVPKERGLHVGQRWTSMGNTFEVIRTEGIAYLGTRLETFVVATPNKRNGTTYFYWSDQAGLVALRFLMRLNGQESVEAMVAEDARGFPF
jgi:hypothetical protein